MRTGPGGDTAVAAARPLALPPVIGHRGAAGRAPENTLAGLRTAAALGVSWVEFDVRLTADEALVLLHDDTLGRTTDGTGRVRQTRLRDIRVLDAGAWFGPAFAGERVPTLEEAVELLAALGLRANIEIKAERGDEVATGEAVARALHRCWPPAAPPPLLSSFRYRCSLAAAAIAPELPVAFLMSWSERDWRRLRPQLAWASLHCSQRGLTRQRVASLEQAGLPIAAFTVNSVRRARALYRIGVDAVFSDYPDVILAALRS